MNRLQITLILLTIMITMTAIIIVVSGLQAVLQIWKSPGRLQVFARILGLRLTRFRLRKISQIRSDIATYIQNFVVNRQTKEYYDDDLLKVITISVKDSENQRKVIIRNQEKLLRRKLQINQNRNPVSGIIYSVSSTKSLLVAAEQKLYQD